MPYLSFSLLFPLCSHALLHSLTLSPLPLSIFQFTILFDFSLFSHCYLSHPLLSFLHSHSPYIFPPSNPLPCMFSFTQSLTYPSSFHTLPSFPFFYFVSLFTSPFISHLFSHSSFRLLIPSIVWFTFLSPFLSLTFTYSFSLSYFFFRPSSLLEFTVLSDFLFFHCLLTISSSLS